jgi:hypothetical protein
MIKRVAIFGVLGPALGYLVSALSVPSGAYLGMSTKATVIGIILIELIPMLLCGLIDFYLREHLWWKRLGAVAAAGFVMVGLTPLVFFSRLNLVLASLHGFGIMGAIPAAICSWLSNMEPRNGRTNAFARGISPKDSTS